ncbi:hypothetical protein I302_102649 [Kwoniella bestiolae CBS 10118]|uniref:SUZ domain-containing protein n=1 Tax=Kwoniella bestiolae CBS 10118 TaxID=1296100 RepID=A0A1B9GFP1_9TREE|nr:hypothetical protein I302_01339 [Kwoniella bestiolae CBS 10118]OCF29826.1 hypothetical protein I302_01339 [Kwoniella bestiolae CBS 10118]
MGSNITDAEEDDWETAEISLPSSSKPAPPPLPSLRPQAQTFQPRPSQPAQQGTFTRYPQQPQAGSSRQPMLLRRPTPQQPADDEDGDGDDWFRRDKPMSNRQIWDSANSRPAPTQILSPEPLPMPSPKVQLLRRPASSSPSNIDQANKGGSKMKSLEEREEQYRLARERIFGSSSEEQVQTQSQEGKISRGSSGGGKARGSPSIKEKEKDVGRNNDPWDGLIPSQIRSGPNTPRDRSPNPINGGLGAAPSPRSAGTGGVVRQPLGPGGGAGFAHSGGSGLGSPGYGAR